MFRTLENKKLILFFILLPFFSCKTQMKGEKIKEGKIEYEIEYKKKTENKLVQALLPTSLSLKFNTKQTKTSFSGNFGLYELTYLADSETNTWSIIYKIKRNIYLYEQTLDDPILLTHDLKIVEIEETGKNKEIAGYTCKELRVKTDSKKNEEYILYYTDKIKFDFATLLNLFGKIDGVLMDFELPQNDMILHITAKELNGEDIPMQEFQIPEKAQKIKKSMMIDLLNTEF